MRSCILRSGWVFSPKMVQCRWWVCVIISKPQEKRHQCTLCCLSELDLEQYLELWSQQVSSLSRFPSRSTWSACALVLSIFNNLFPPPVFDLCHRILTQSGVLWVTGFIVISEDSVSSPGPGRGFFGSVWVKLLRYEASYLILIYSTSCHVAPVFDLHALPVVPHHCYLPSSADTLTGQRSAATSGSYANVRTRHPSCCVTCARVCFNMGCGTSKMHPRRNDRRRDAHGHVTIQPHLWETLGKNNLHSTQEGRKVKRTKHCGEF